MTSRTRSDAPVDTAGRDTPLRRQILEAARALTVASGWSTVTMGALADIVGVSRQTVYTEVGSKPALAESLVLDELAGFLALVDESFERRPDDAVAATRDAVESVLVFSRSSPLLRAVVSATHGADNELLPLLTTNAAPLLDTATSLLAARLDPAMAHLGPRQRAAVVDVVVRVVLSHVMQPSGSPAATADAVGWTVSRLIGAPGG